MLAEQRTLHVRRGIGLALRSTLIGDRAPKQLLGIGQITGCDIG